MNKFILYSLGVFSWISALSCKAAEMFEVLPDLPDPLAYAVQPAVAASVSGTADATVLGTQSIGHEPSMVSVVLSLVFVVILIYLTGILYAKLTKAGFRTLKRQQGDFAKNQVSVVSTTQLGNNKTLHVVELDGKRMLIGASSSAIQLIKDLGSCEEDADNENYSRIEIPNIKIPKIEIPKIEIPSIGFSKLVTKAHKALKDVETEPVATQPEVKDEPSAEENTVSEEITSDGIIDSLFSQKEMSDVDVVPDVNPVEEHVVDPDDFALYKKYLG